MTSENRKLAAIVFTDIVGFTQLSSDNEPAALKLLDTQRKLLKPIVKSFNGEWLKEIGDGLLLSFGTNLEAVKCAIEIQISIKEIDNLNLRIGIHQGEVVFRDNDVIGDDVNIASRIEPFSAVGGIAISDRVNASIERNPNYKTLFIGKPKLKGVGQKIEVYCIISHGLPKTQIKKISAKLEQKSGNNVLILSLISSIIICLVIYLFLNTNIFSSKEIHEKSVAVLPFDNYSSAEDDQYFSDGLTEVIIANLAKIKDLKVISRTSVMQYKGTTKPLTEIGNELGVANILEGSVQRGNNRIRIVGQLIDTQTDEHIWAETYDNVITDLFDIQINVAKKIANVLHAEISPEEANILNNKPTENLEAWDYYLKGIEYVNKSYRADDLELAAFFLEKAVKTDPNFAEAFAKLAKHYIFTYWSGHDRSEKRKQLAKSKLDIAMKLDPDNPNVRIARGYYYYHGFREYERALEDFKYAIEKLPGKREFNEHIAYIKRRMGDFNECNKYLKIAFEYDSQNSALLHNIAESYICIHDFINAEKYFLDVIKLAPDVDLYYRDFANLYYWKGQISKAIGVIDEAMKLISSDNLLYAKAWLQYINKSYDKSLETLQSIKLIIYKQQTQYTPVDALIGMNYLRLGKQKHANKFLTSAKEILENEIIKNPEDIRIQMDYALILGYLGLKEEAIKIAELASSKIPIEIDAIIGVKHFITYTKVLSIVGEHNKAIENLEIMKNMPVGPTLESLKIDPIWDLLRKLPKFQSLLNNEYGKITS